jgi:hypothetical protein
MKQLVLIAMVVLLSAPPVLAQNFCKGDFTYDGDVDADDVTTFLGHFGRGQYYNPCPPDGPAPVAKTGQYQTYSWEDDGFWGKGVAVEYPYPRFEPDPILPFVRDKLTGLLWFKFPEENFTWEQAIDFCARAYIYGTYRLPNIKEMMSLINYGWENPALCGIYENSHHSQGNPFTLPVIQYYWTSTTYQLDTNRAWYYNIDNGALGHQVKSIQMNAWCVSDGRPIYPRFIDNDDGTVTDNKTGLVWLKDANCFGTRNWNQAITDCQNLGVPDCNLTDGSQAGDWRLPTKEEWKAFICTQYTDPAVCNTRGLRKWSEGDPFNNVQSNSFYWSSTEYDSTTAWVVFTFEGDILPDDKINNNYLWPVRDP